jgi:hypothetical protein
MLVNVERKLNFATIAAEQIDAVEDEVKVLVGIKLQNFRHCI